MSEIDPVDDLKIDLGNVALPPPSGLPRPNVGGTPKPPEPKETKGADPTQYYYDDEEERAVQAIKAGKGVTYNHSDQYERTEAMLNQSYKDLRAKHPQGGLKSSRFITWEIIEQAPDDFFDRFESIAKEATTWVQTTMADRGASDAIGEAQANPRDEALQDKAFRAIQTVAMEYLDRTSSRGIVRNLITYMIAADMLGFSRIDPLLHDSGITEIAINGPYDVQVEIRGKMRKVPCIKFRDVSHLENLLERIFGQIGKSLSRSTPLLDGRLLDQSRIAASHRLVSPAGPNVAIRRHAEKFWTPQDLIDFNSATPELMTDVGNMIYNGCSFVVIGGTGSGKTSMLNAMSGFFNPNERVLTLEDTLELKIHPSKLAAAPMECVPANPHKKDDHGVTMRDLVKTSLRMRPDGIVIGEIRDGSMYDLCQGLNTGHWGASTVHANSPEDGVQRMQGLVTESGLISAEGAIPLIATAFDFVIMVQRFPQDGSRKITSISELALHGKLGSDGRPFIPVKKLWEFEASEWKDGDEKITGEWVKKGELSDTRKHNRQMDLVPRKSWEELQEIFNNPGQ